MRLPPLKPRKILANTAVIAIGTTIGLLYLLAEPLSTTIKYYGGHLGLYLDSVPPLEMWTRLIFVLLFVLFGAFAQLLFIRQRLTLHQLRRSERMAQATSRLVTVGEMASGIAHEINNPLTSILGYSDLLMRQEIPENIRQDLALIHDSAERVAQIEKRLLAFSRQQKPERNYLDINHLIVTSLELRSYAMQNENIRVRTELDDSLPWIISDGGQLQQVLVNVIMNAETAMKTARRGGSLKIVSRHDGDTVSISISDDGPGIPRENLERVFDPFFTTREVGQGTGLGLSVCHGIMTELKGSISAASQPGYGATFTITLPAITEADPTVAGAPDWPQDYYPRDAGEGCRLATRP